MKSPNTLIMWITRTSVGVGLLVLSFVMVSWLMATAPQAEATSDQLEARSVVVIEPSPVDVARQFTGYGVARAIEDADVPARVSSTVVRLPATSRAGNRVKVGDVLIELDSTDFREEVTMAQQRLIDLAAQMKSLDVEEKAARQSIEIAQQDLQLVQREFDRVKEAVAREAAMPREADQVEKLVLAAQQLLLKAEETLARLETRRLALNAQKHREAASERMARERVDRCTIASPIDGFIERIDVSQGDNLAAGQRVARIIDPRHIEVPLSLPASARGDVAVGNDVMLATTGSRKRTWPARVARVSPEDDPSSRTMRIYAEVTQPMVGEGHLAPGAFLEAEVTADQGQEGWIVPRRSVRKDRILLVRDGSIISIPISIRYPIRGEFEEFDIPDRDWVVLDKPLSPGEQVVLSPSRTLSDGMPVTPVAAGRSLVADRGDEP